MSNNLFTPGNKSKSDYLVSVVMAVGEVSLEYLKQSVDSILTQTYSNFEFIIVVDISPTSPQRDKTVRLIQSYAECDRRIFIILNHIQQGFPLSINEAIRASKGRYTMRMDADDISAPDRIEKQLQFLLSNPNIDICGTQYYLIDKCGVTIKTMSKPCRPDYCVEYAKHYTPIAHPTFMLKKEVYELLGYYRNITPGQDWDFLIRAIKGGFKLANINYYGLFYRQSVGSISNKDPALNIKYATILRRSYSCDNVDFLLESRKSLSSYSGYLNNLISTKYAIVRFFSATNRYRPVGRVLVILLSFAHYLLLVELLHQLRCKIIIKQDRNAVCAVKK